MNDNELLSFSIYSSMLFTIKKWMAGKYLLHKPSFSPRLNLNTQRHFLEVSLHQSKKLCKYVFKIHFSYGTCWNSFHDLFSPNIYLNLVKVLFLYRVLSYREENIFVTTHTLNISHFNNKIITPNLPRPAENSRKYPISEIDKPGSESSRQSEYPSSSSLAGVSRPPPKSGLNLFSSSDVYRRPVAVGK